MNSDKGFTLVELIIAMAIMSIIALVTANFLGFGIKTHKLSSDEFTVQSTMRILSSNMNNSIRNSSATFTLYRPNHNNLSEKWNYIMVSEDKKSVVKYEWDESQKKHIKSTIMDEIDGVTFSIEFVKNKSSHEDKLIQYKIVANMDNKKDKVIESELEALNSLQVIDRGSNVNPSNALAYRFDPRPGEVSDTQAAVAMVLDKSGSMDDDMNGKRTSKKENTRIYKLKAEANRLINNLAFNPNVYISLNPFNSTANSSDPMLPAQINSGTNSALTNTINNITTAEKNTDNRGTNTGDGMRRAYHRINEFNDAATKRTKNFMIILVDGVTTFSSVRRVDYNYRYGINVDDKNFVTGDNSIANTWIKSSNQYNRDYINGAFFGNGSSLDKDGTRYVNLIGNMIKNYKSKYGEGIKVYVIGFSNVRSDFGSLGDIAKAATGENKYYEAGDEKVLREIFDMIKKDIDDSLWHIGGPN